MTVREDRDNRQRGGRKDIGDLASRKNGLQKEDDEGWVSLGREEKNAPKAALGREEERREGK